MMSRLLPLILFVLLGILLAVGLSISDKKTIIPSPLIGRQVPDFNLPALHEPERQISHTDLLGEPYLINFWGSWCPTCVYEHPVIKDLARDGNLRIVGLNFRDEPEDAKNWLLRHGDPYDEIVVDYTGRTSINFGVYAAPGVIPGRFQRRDCFQTNRCLNAGNYCGNHHAHGQEYGA